SSGEELVGGRRCVVIVASSLDLAHLVACRNTATDASDPGEIPTVSLVLASGLVVELEDYAHAERRAASLGDLPERQAVELERVRRGRHRHVVENTGERIGRDGDGARRGRRGRVNAHHGPDHGRFAANGDGYGRITERPEDAPKLGALWLEWRRELDVGELVGAVPDDDAGPADPRFSVERERHLFAALRHTRSPSGRGGAPGSRRVGCCCC